MLRNSLKKIHLRRSKSLVTLGIFIANRMGESFPYFGENWPQLNWGLGAPFHFFKLVSPSNLGPAVIQGSKVPSFCLSTLHMIP